jgi:UDP-2,3-diacylglucosamine hydrolase
MATLFISDLHLSPSERPAVVDLFLSFLSETASQAEALYILGDFFEYWIGDETVLEGEFQPIIRGLQHLTRSGVPVNIMHGNRDFLIGEKFARETGCRLLADPALIELYGYKTLLMHGDTLCTDDVEYQRVRVQVRSQAWADTFLARSLAERNALMRDYREMSKNAVSAKKPEIMDVNQQTVLAVMKRHQVRHLIHGHTHRPGQHEFPLEGQIARRIVLGDWYEQGSVLRCDTNGWVLKNMALDS